MAYPLSLRPGKELMRERGVFVDHATLHRWAIKVLPVLLAVFRRRKHSAGRSWRMDETHIKVSGQWKYLYRAADRDGDAVDFLLTARHVLAAARRFMERAVQLHDVPEKITTDKSGAHTAAIGCFGICGWTCTPIKIRHRREQTRAEAQSQSPTDAPQHPPHAAAWKA